VETDNTGKVKFGQPSSIENSLDGYKVGYLGEAVDDHLDGILTPV
jgi:hypothetical protein